jgi:hypothetical protein
LRLIQFLPIIFVLFAAGCITVSKGYLKDDYYLYGKDGSMSAVIYMGTYIENGSIKAWVDKKNGILYKSPEKKVRYGLLSSFEILKVTGKTSDGVYEAYLRLNPEKEVLAKSLEQSLKKAENLYYEHCTTCHTISNVKAYSKHHWAGILESMIVQSALTKSQESKIRRYVSVMLN